MLKNRQNLLTLRAVRLISPAMSWARRASIAARKFKVQHDALAAQLRSMREELQVAHRQRRGLEIALDVRGKAIAELRGRVDQLKAENRRLDTEAEYLAQLFRRENARQRNRHCMRRARRHRVTDDRLVKASVLIGEGDWHWLQIRHRFNASAILRQLIADYRRKVEGRELAHDGWRPLDLSNL